MSKALNKHRQDLVVFNFIESLLALEVQIFIDYIDWNSLQEPLHKRILLFYQSA